jgi:dienelactone hydrolase
MTIEWRDDTRAEAFRQRVGTVDPGGPDGRRVPVALWTPLAGAGSYPLVLIGHGGAGHKQDDSRLDLAQRYTGAGVAAAAIDGPWHGEREAPETARTYDETTVDAMVADWRTTLDALVSLPEVDAARVGYGGVSMGTMFGLPFVASEPRIRTATLGLCGLRRADGSPLPIAGRLERDARALTSTRVLFLLQWDDELFERAGVLELFDLLATREKQLIANPGLHHDTPLHARAASTAFLVEALRDDDGHGAGDVH